MKCLVEECHNYLDCPILDIIGKKKIPKVSTACSFFRKEKKVIKEEKKVKPKTKKKS